MGGIIIFADMHNGNFFGHPPTEDVPVYYSRAYDDWNVSIIWTKNDGIMMKQCWVQYMRPILRASEVELANFS